MNGRSAVEERRTDLTPCEKLRVAVMVLCEGVPQHVAAAGYGVNPARVGTMLAAIRQAIGLEEKPEEGGLGV